MDDKFFIGYYGNYSLDENGRMFLPAKIGAEKGEAVVVTSSVCRQEKCLKLMSYEVVADRINVLIQKRDNSATSEEYTRYDDLIIEYCSALDNLLKVDSQHRICLPKKILEKAEIDSGDTLEVFGGGNVLIYTKKR